MRRREIWIIVIAIVLIGGIWASCSVVNNAAMDNTAPVERSDFQNGSVNAPSEQQPAAGTTGTNVNP